MKREEVCVVCRGRAFPKNGGFLLPPDVAICKACWERAKQEVGGDSKKMISKIILWYYLALKQRGGDDPEIAARLRCYQECFPDVYEQVMQSI